MTTPDTIAAAIDAGRRLTQVLSLEGHRTMISIPSENALKEIPREKLEDPRFMTGFPQFNDVAPFIQYVNDFKDLGTRLFYTRDGRMVAVLDYHMSGQARHGDHCAGLQLMRSPEWETWMGANGKPMNQQVFAEFVEDNALDILEPGPEAMLEVATSLHATTGATFRRAMNLANGQVQLQYDENVEAKVAGGTKDIPTSFVLGLRPFMGGCRFRLECRLRYRIQGGALVFFFKALKPDHLTETTIDAIVARVKDETGIVPALGAHDAAAVAKGI